MLGAHCPRAGTGAAPSAHPHSLDFLMLPLREASSSQQISPRSGLLAKAFHSISIRSTASSGEFFQAMKPRSVKTCNQYPHRTSRWQRTSATDNLDFSAKSLAPPITCRNFSSNLAGLSCRIIISKQQKLIHTFVKIICSFYTNLSLKVPSGSLISIVGPPDNEWALGNSGPVRHQLNHRTRILSSFPIPPEASLSNKSSTSSEESTTFTPVLFPRQPDSSFWTYIASAIFPDAVKAFSAANSLIRDQACAGSA